MSAGCACSVCGGLSARLLDYQLATTEIASKTWAVHGLSENLTFDNGGNIVNTAFIEVPEGVVVIDTGPSKRYGEALVSLIERTVPGKPILRVYNTHHHPDHVFGNQAFDAQIIAAPQGVIDNIAVEGNMLADNMYRLVGDWMRGTAPVVPQVILETGNEDIGGRQFSIHSLAGHTSSDLVVRDDSTGVVFTGDLAFLYRAPTTPHAKIATWRESISTLEALDRDLLLPGHGPSDEVGESLTQTADYLDWLDGTLREAVLAGLTMNEAMALPIPQRFQGLNVVKEEYDRSVVHLYPALENTLLLELDVSRD